MISNEIVVNYKVVYLIEIYNFGFGHFPSRVICTIWKKKWISKFERFKQNSRTVNGFKWKSHQLQSCRLRRDLQLWYKVCFHLTLFEKVMNMFILQHGYHRRIIQRAGGESVFTAGSYGEAVEMRSTSSPPAGGANRCDDGLSPSVGKKRRW
jgi:hypothetical protein